MRWVEKEAGVCVRGVCSGCQSCEEIKQYLGCYQLPVFAAKHRHTKQDTLVIRKVVKL